MGDLIRRVKDVIHKERLIEPGDRVLLGVSGGVDSTTLLSVLREISREISFTLALAHVNHLLRGRESERDEGFVKGLADLLSLPCYVKRVNVRDEARRVGKSLQHAGRDVRYSFFDAIADEHNFNKIAIAHNLDDQVETFLLRITKGTGIRGLSSIPMRRGRIIRPFLTTTRAAIEAYAQDHKVPFVEDSSNAKIVYERNFVRREILPLMERLNPAVRDKIFSLLQDLTVINRAIDRRVDTFLRKELRRDGEDVSIKIEALTALDEETRYRAFVRLLQMVEPGFIPLREHIRLTEKVLCGARPNLSGTLPHGVRVKKVYDRFSFTKKTPPTPIKEVFPVTVGENRLDSLDLILSIVEMEVPPGKLSLERKTVFFDRDKASDLSVRTFMEGDRFVPLGMDRFVKLKDFFISRKIPREMRRSIPLLLSGKEIVWVIGHRLDERHKVTADTTQVLKVTATISGP
ncbi:MAG: tRNA(Ile)-lysidine synthase [Syntrophorhabdus sp. PtaU1.Bin002]|nr:MAG: tRNA(Ile)-lysidine synthase [Syntrophorhabdus sp. PtaB.Bin006]OPY73473.1 MAG: tRNA(Ile)-lysidine synthase [Syntrophorhabdus sp. PtaU1.Bin002]